MAEGPRSWTDEVFKLIRPKGLVVGWHLDNQVNQLTKYQAPARLEKFQSEVIESLHRSALQRKELWLDEQAKKVVHPKIYSLVMKFRATPSEVPAPARRYLQRTCMIKEYPGHTEFWFKGKLVDKLPRSTIELKSNNLNRPLTLDINL